MKKIIPLTVLTVSFFSGAVMASSDPVCREYTRDIRVGGKIEQAYGTACRQEDGSWKMEPEASATIEPTSERIIVLADGHRDRWDDDYGYHRRHPQHWRAPQSYFSFSFGDFDNGHGHRHGHRYGRFHHGGREQCHSRRGFGHW